MRKKILCLLLCLFLLSGQTLCAAGAEKADRRLTISTTEEFLLFAENCRLDSYSTGLSVTLKADLDLTNTGFQGIPIFCGTFIGGNHTISGLSLTPEGSVTGLFRYLTETAVVRNLNVSGTVEPGSSRESAGGIVGSNAGILQNCSFSGTVSGSSRVGGIAGSNTGIIRDSDVQGNVHGNHFVGGIAGENSGTIFSCRNSAAVNTTAKQNNVDLSDITMGTVIGTESFNTVTDVGGIAGNNSGTIRNCVNSGSVGYRQMGYNIGGIAGRQSGYLVGCENRGDISGRKEVGGIVGQLEPWVVLRYSTDALQLLEEQLGILSGLVDEASQHIESNTDSIRNQIWRLDKEVENARDIIAGLVADLEHPDQLTVDTITDALARLGTSLTDTVTILNRLSGAVEHTANDLTRDLKAISTQIGVIEGLLETAENHLGGSVADISDDDTPEDTTAKVECCHNYGAILADLNAGGIAGAICPENDLDPEEDVQIIGNNSLYAAGTVRGVILGCSNRAQISVRKQNAGGIIGWQPLGLVKDCLNTGSLDAAPAEYTGGIAGRSGGYIRHCSVRADIAGTAYVGGIAGTGAVVTDCHSLVRIHGTEMLGAVLGNREGNSTTDPLLQGNFFLSTGAGMGAVDGISYSGCAEPLSLKAFLALENLDDTFRSVSVCFILEDGTQIPVDLPLGSKLSPKQIPALPEKAGYTARWDALEETDLSSLYFDMTFQAVYTAHSTTIQAETLREDGRTVLLIQGSFTEESLVHVTHSTDAPALEPKQQLLESWHFEVQNAEKVTGCRFLLPVLPDSGSVALHLHSTDGSWSSIPWVQDGSYLVVPLSEGIDGLALVATEASYLPFIIAAAGGIALIAAIVAGVALRKRSRRKPMPQADNT